MPTVLQYLDYAETTLAAYGVGLLANASVTRSPNDTREWEDVIPGLRWECGNDSIVSGSRLGYVEDRLDARWVVKSGGVEAIVWLSGSAGNSDVSAGDTVFGGEGEDLIAGTDEGDVLSGDAGKDVLLGNGGDDAVYGGDDDEMTGGGGDDYLDGGSGGGKVYGGHESDTLFAGEVNDQTYGDLPTSEDLSDKGRRQRNPDRRRRQRRSAWWREERRAVLHIRGTANIGTAVPNGFLHATHEAKTTLLAEE